MLNHIIQKIKGAPKNPGIYIFYRGKDVLYVGKASNLRNRLKSYLKITDIKTNSLHEEATSLKIITLRSNIEALIVESKMIKELKPKYNVLFKDDKNYFYVAITKEAFPRIFITHQPEHLKAKSSQPKADSIGPFTDGAPLKSILRLIRRTIPYCTHKPHLLLCLDAQINNCPGYCCQKENNVKTEELKNYKRNINKIKRILTGKNRKFLKSLKDPYELLVLEKIWAHKPYLDSQKSKVKSLKWGNLEFSKIECYDNSHLSGKEAVGAMTAWRNENGAWSTDRNMWRKFKIIGDYTEDDPRMMEEMVSRRLNHPEWPYPDLLIIDGGITQFNAATRAVNRIMNNESGKRNENGNIIHNSKFIIPKLISFAKPNQEVYGLKPLPVPITELPEDFQRIIRMAIQNTHNFVLRYHRAIRRKQFLPKFL